jgi:hypothetical protein
MSSTFNPSLFSSLSLSSFSLALSPCVLSLSFYVLSLTAFVAPFFSISLARCQFLVFTLYDDCVVSPSLFFSLYLFLSLSFSLSICLSLSLITFANTISMTR